jgi:biotin carboxyl carrier protein
VVGRAQRNDNGGGGVILAIEDLRRLAGWMEAGGIGTLEWEHEQGRLRLVLAATPAREVMAVAGVPGRFIAIHPARDTAFAPPGTVVRQGDVLGLVRHGLVYSGINAPCDGTVLAQLVAEDDLIGFGDPVMVIAEAPA